MNIISDGHFWVTTPTFTTGTWIKKEEETLVSKFEQAFKIAQLMVDRTALAKNDLAAFLELVKEIEAVL